MKKITSFEQLKAVLEESNATDRHKAALSTTPQKPKKKPKKSK